MSDYLKNKNGLISFIKQFNHKSNAVFSLIGNLMYQKIIDLGLESNAVGCLGVDAELLVSATRHASQLNREPDTPPLTLLLLIKNH